ncbi:MAG: hypothetical protein ACREV9_02755 [Burkholderiales bacterium]
MSRFAREDRRSLDGHLRVHPAVQSLATARVRFAPGGRAGLDQSS